MKARLELFVKNIVRGGHGPRKYLFCLPVDVLEKWEIRCRIKGIKVIGVYFRFLDVGCCFNR